MTKTKGNLRLHHSFLILFLASLPAATLAGDPYLEGLKAESSQLESLGQQARQEQATLERHAEASANKKPDKTDKTAGKTAAKAPEPPRGVAEFEKGLKAYPAGFGLYEKLDDTAKQTVFAEYAKGENETRRYAAAIRKTIELSIPARSAK